MAPVRTCRATCRRSTSTFDRGEFAEAGYWYRNYHYRREEESGYAAGEDLYSPGTVDLAVRRDRTCRCLAFSTERRGRGRPQARRGSKRRQAQPARDHRRLAQAGAACRAPEWAGTCWRLPTPS